MNVSIWHGMYGIPWKGIATDACAAHPAKFSKALVFRLVAHAIEEGWLTPGVSTCVDPFGGVGLGALPCALEGIAWRGVELEQHFLTLAHDNFALWQRRYGALPQWRTPVLVQGNSMELRQVLEAAGGELVLSSPPYAESINSERNGIDWSKTHHGSFEKKHGHTPYSSHATGIMSYGTHPAQLGNLPPGSVEAVVSSPPFMQSDNRQDSESLARLNTVVMRDRKVSGGNFGRSMGLDYGTSPAQLGNAAPSTFWEAARAIVAETFALLAPGGHAIWVTKSYVRDKKIVDFPNQWRMLCESCGFVTLHEHHALQVEHHEELGLFGEPVTMHHVEKKGFFRRLHEKKHPETRIDHETIWCMQKPASATEDGAGGVTACLSSPPFSDMNSKPVTGIDPTKHRSKPMGPHSMALSQGYGNSPGNLGALPTGTLDAVLSSPPYNLPMSQSHNGRKGGRRGTTPSEPGAFVKYGSTPGQLEGLPPGTPPEETP